MPANLENSAVATGLEKVSFHSNPKERPCKACSNYHTIAFISHTSKVMLKIPQARLQQYMNHKLPDVQAEFRKGREEPEIKLPTSKRQESYRKTSISGSLTTPLTVDCVDDNIQPWHTPFPIWIQSVVPHLVLTVASWPAYGFLRRGSSGLVFPSPEEFSSLF